MSEDEAPEAAGPPEAEAELETESSITAINPLRIAVICPTLERQDLIHTMIGSLAESIGAASSDPAVIGIDLQELRVVIVASGSDDGTALWARNHGCAVIESPEPLPFAKAVNLGAKAAIEQFKADWLIIVNNDIIFLPGYWKSLAEMISWGTDIAGAKLIYPKGHQHAGQIQHFGKMFTFDGYPFHVLRYQGVDHEKAQQPRPFPSVTFALVAVKAGLWGDLNGLDEGYVNGYEDDDFCLRAREVGASIGVHPGMTAFHLESQTSGHDNANKEVQWQRFQQQWIESGRIQWPLGVWQGWRTA